MFPLLILALLVGCQGPSVVDETRYVDGSTDALLARSQELVQSHNYKEALLQLYAVNHNKLSFEQSRWVRDQIVKIYQAQKDEEQLIAYLQSRQHQRAVTAEEAPDNLYDLAEAYHRASLNYWARWLGMGSPYRRIKFAREADRLYQDFINKYPNDPRIAYVEGERARLHAYIVHYDAEVARYRRYRASEQA